MSKTIKISDELYIHLIKRMKARETFDLTLKRLLRFKKPLELPTELPSKELKEALRKAAQKPDMPEPDRPGRV